MKLHHFTDKIADWAEAAAGWVPDALMAGGAAAVAYGAWLIYPPAGAIVAGLFALGFGGMASRGAK